MLNQTKTPTFVQTNQFRHLLFPIETVKRHDGINEVVQTSIIRKQAKTQQVENMKKKNSQKNSNIDDLLKGKTPEEQIAILKEALQTEEPSSRPLQRDHKRSRIQIQNKNSTPIRTDPPITREHKGTKEVPQLLSHTPQTSTNTLQHPLTLYCLIMAPDTNNFAPTIQQKQQT